MAATAAGGFRRYLGTGESLSFVRLLMDWSYLGIWIGLPGLAAYIAHRKGRSWIEAAFLTMLVPPVGIVAAFLQSPHPSTGQPTNTKGKILFGLSPLWAAIIVVIAGSYTSPSPEYWNVAPWIIVVAFPACAITLALHEVTARSGVAASRSLRRRKFLIAICLLIPFPYFLWHTWDSVKQSKQENQLALNYTLNNEQLIKLMGGPFEVYPASSTTYQDKRRGRYEYSVRGRNDRYVIIDVFRDSKPPKFSIACVTTLSMGKRETGKDDCQQATVPLPRVQHNEPAIPSDLPQAATGR